MFISLLASRFSYLPEKIGMVVKAETSINEKRFSACGQACAFIFHKF
jgi:hypothetical protein